MTTQPLARYGACDGALASGLTTSVTPRPGTRPLHKRPGKGVLKAVSVSGVEFIRDQLMDEQAALPRPRINSLTAGSVNLMLGISFYPVFQALVTAGKLVSKPDGTYAYDQILAFADEHIFANEMGMRGQRPTGILRSWMDAHGVKPAFDFATKGGLIYRRAEVEPLLEMVGRETVLSKFNHHPNHQTHEFSKNLFNGS